LLVSGAADFEALAFSGQLRGEGGRADRAGVITPGVGIDGLPAGVSFSLRGEPQLGADVARSGSAGTFTVKDSCFELAAVQATEDLGLVADLQRCEDGFPHDFEFGVAAVRFEGDGLSGVGDPGGFAIGGGQACRDTGPLATSPWYPVPVGS
jgi:hypothetical protein